MTWKKETYLITVADEGGKHREYVSGVTADIEGYKVGIHKADAAVWIVTDLSTGYVMQIQSTQKAAKAWVQGNAEVIIEILSKPGHEAIVKEIETCRIK